ncbi:MAG: tetratricopeptide repeat protein [bacterium]|nr:tetratricopeptide repeat protein [bacterium]
MASDPDKKRVSIEELQQAVAASPDSAQAHMKLATAWLRAGSGHKAEESLRRAVEIDPGYDEAWVNLGGIALGRWDFAECVKINRTVAERNPELLQAHFNQGLGHLYLREADKMVSCFRRVLEIDPDHAAGQYHLAVGLLELGEVEAARAALDRAAGLGHSPAPEFLKALERKEKDVGKDPETES